MLNLGLTKVHPIDLLWKHFTHKRAVLHCDIVYLYSFIGHIDLRLEYDFSSLMNFVFNVFVCGVLLNYRRGFMRCARACTK